MKKILALITLLFFASFAFSQSYNNEWIDYSKTYYKFRLSATGLYRITTSALTTVGLNAQPAENFQLWRNGKQVPLFTSTASGVLGASGYIEFWGERNDGTLDKALYRVPADQLSDQLSLQTDSSTYFLTVSSGTANLRFSNSANNVAGNTLPPEPWFIYALRNNYSDQIHRGRANVYGGEYLYSSTYDMGEMFSSVDINPSTPITTAFSNLFVATSGPTATFRAAVAGSAPNGFSSVDRSYKIELNNTLVIDTIVNQFDARINYNNSVPLSVIASNNASFKITNKFSNSTDRIVCGFIELDYARQFNFGGSSVFRFNLAASASAKYLEISNFTAGSGAPVLYDLTNNRRYVADLSTPGMVKILLQPSLQPMNLVLVSQSIGILEINSLQSRTFVNYSQAANQGDYLIISHNSLQAISNGANQVDEYRKYRASAAGGSFNAKICDIEQLVDQFAFGVKKHPLSIKNFLRYARNTFAQPPKFALLIGHGLTYADYRSYESTSQAERLNLVPTFGYPASDVLLASNTLEPVMSTLIGRISAVTPQEVAIYLSKLKEYELAQSNGIQTTDSKAWMKNVVHVAGGNDANLELRLIQYLGSYENVIRDTSFGGQVINFNKTTSGPVTPIVSVLMEQTWQNGISILNYFGHSSSSALDYNLDDPSVYNNTGKYPMFIVNGCNAGNLYAFDTSRFSVFNTLSEKYVLAPNKGSIGFIASTHFGLENYLDYYNKGLYRSIGITGYGKSIAYNINEAIAYLLSTYGSSDFGTRLHAEQTTLHGDPAVKINSFSKPDFVVEEQGISISPTIVSVADNNFNVKIHFNNIGKATGDSVSIYIKRQYPTGEITTLLAKSIRSVRSLDSVNLTVPIIATRDKGVNKIIVSIDTLNEYDELSEFNNTVTKTFIINENEIRPVYPYQYSIINSQLTKFYASTANPVMGTQQFMMEIDTTEDFNSSLKKSYQVNGTGGLLEFAVSNFTFRDSVVYYWRTAIQPSTGSNIIWNNASFVYLSTGSTGFGQMHYFQFRNNSYQNLFLDNDRQFKYQQIPVDINVSTGNFPPNDYPLTFVDVKNNRVANWGNNFGTLQFAVLDGKTLEALENRFVGTKGSYNSNLPDGGRIRQFEYYFTNQSARHDATNFMDSIANGSYVIIWNLQYTSANYASYVNTWKSDTTAFGPGNSLYHKFMQFGLNKIENFSGTFPFIFIFKKNDPSFVPIQYLGKETDILTASFSSISYQVNGSMVTPYFGPSKLWKSLQWKGRSLDPVLKDSVAIEIYGTDGVKPDELVATIKNAIDTSVAFINAAKYPYLKLKMLNKDYVYATPNQLQYWLLKGDYVAEGALAPNISFEMKDTFELGEALNFTIAFKNISTTAFDSLALKLIITDKNNVPNIILLPKKKKLLSGDTILVKYTVNTGKFPGMNTMFLDVNPDNDQPEQYHFNNFLYKNFFVKSDTYNPLLDVTFDGVHILNGDIVSAKPKILVKLKDEAKFLALDDTSLSQVYVRYPGNNGALRRFAFGTDTLKFIPADLTTGKNEAMIEFNPYFFDDSGNDFYELIVRAKDKSGNSAGNMEYKVRFQVINKPMISNMFNYPNPFTTSTAFVFTLTGSEVPQNLRIQVLTVTGKIVKDITKAELGGLHIGRNITDYKWDGTDQYGQKLANGIYLYRVITNQNGHALDKYNTLDANGDKVNTDKFFNKGYGKMYLMR